MNNQPGADAVASANANSNVKLVYILYLVGLIVGVTGLIGLIMAYVFRSEAPAWAQTHYRVQIRTFWIALLYGVIGAITILILVGWLVFAFTFVWYIVRCVKGLNYASRQEAYPNPATWIW